VCGCVCVWLCGVYVCVVCVNGVGGVCVGCVCLLWCVCVWCV